MSRHIVLPAKRSGETFQLRVTFQDLMPFGEILGAGAVQVKVSSGEDSNPDAILFGGAAVDGFYITQTITGGVPGVIYQLNIFAHGSGDHIYSKGAKLAIVDSPENFTGD